ncbi:MAG TPA: DUF3299 domain-containing protein [Limnobacter sp.]|nr:DUF3299 domain-containing protein [Limnobacter sp.]
MSKAKKIVVIGVALALLTGLGYGLTKWIIGENTAPATELEQALAGIEGEAADGNGYAVGDRLAADSSKKAANFDPAYPELQWDDLMPADWDPMAAFRGLNVAELQDDDPKAQEALEKMRKAWNDAPVNPALAGKKVRIPGFAIPVEQSEKGVDELLLVPYFGACIHTPPPPANQIIHVKLTEPQPAIGAMQAYWVWGELSASRFSNELGEAAYLISAKGIQPYED